MLLNIEITDSLKNWNKKSWEYIFSKDGFLNGANKLRETINKEQKMNRNNGNNRSKIPINVLELLENNKLLNLF